MNNLVIIVSLCLLHDAVHGIPLVNEASRGVLTPDDRQHSSIDLNKEKLELLKKQIEDLGKSLDKLSQTYRPSSESVEGTYNEDEVTSGVQAKDNGIILQTKGGDEIDVDVKGGTEIQTLEGDISQNGKLNSMSVEQLELLEKILSERLETLRNEKRGNQEGFDPMAQTNDVNSKDLLPAPNENIELPERDDSSGKFVGKPFAPEELGAVKDFQEDENIGNEETATEVSDAEKKSDCSSMVCLGTVDSICGTDDKNYANECELSVAACKNKDIQIRHKGECKTVADVLITALMLDIQLLLDNGVGFDEIHKLMEDKRNDILSESESDYTANAEQRLNYLVSKARKKNEPDYTERPLNGMAMM